MRILWTAFRLFVLLTFVTGAVYPALVGLAALAMPDRAGGSLVSRGGRTVGSRLLAQSFASDRYVHPRPSAASFGTVPSGASNLGPTSRVRADAFASRRQAWLRSESDAVAPAEMLCASGSGLDPHISPEAALAQLPRLAVARGWEKRKILIAGNTVRAMTEGPQYGFLGPERVNVLLLNLALDEL